MIVKFLVWLGLLPVQLGLALLLILTDLARHLGLRSARSPGRTGSPPDSGLCSIVVVNHNGKALLEESLPALERAVSCTGKPHEVILVDNGSSDGSVSWIRNHLPRIRILELDANLGFGEGNNRGVALAQREIVVLLNNDMIVAEDFLPPLLEPFSDDQVFAVSSQIHFPPEKRREETGNTQARMRRGFLHLSHEPLRRSHETRKTLPVFWAGGGSSAYRRSRFLELGGFSGIFSPAYLEDTDLSYRAWRRGWTCLLAAGSRVLHRHRSTSSRLFTPDSLKRLIGERKLWYLWKNFQLRTLLPHLLLYPWHLGKELRPGDYLRAFRRLPDVLRLRWREPRRRHSDRTLIGLCRRPLSYVHRKPGRSIPSPTPPDFLKILAVSAYLPALGRHGGAGRVFQFLSRVSARHQIHLISFTESDDESEAVDQLRPYCARLELVPRRGFEPVSLYPYEPFEEFNCPDFRRRFEKVLEEEEFDLIHYEWPQMAQYDDLVPVWVPRMLTEMEVNYAAHYSRVRLASKFFSKVKRHYETLQTLFREVGVCRRMDQVVCVTTVDRSYLDGFVPGARLKVLPTGVDTSYFIPGTGKAEPNSILYVGAFRHEPNVDAMLFFVNQVLPLLREEIRETHLYIVGSSPTPEIRAMDDHPAVTVTGFVPDLREYYDRAQVVVVPVRTGVGIRGKVLEAWACGKAVVGTSLAFQGIPAVHGQNALVAETPAEFAIWISALMRNPAFTAHLAESGRRTVTEHYDWEPLAARLADLYEETAKFKKSGN